MHFKPQFSRYWRRRVYSKIGYRNLLNPIFFHIIVLKDPKGYKNIKKYIWIDLIFWEKINQGTKIAIYISIAALTMSSLSTKTF